MSHGTEARLLLQPKSHAQIRGCHVHQTEQLRAGLLPGKDDEGRAEEPADAVWRRML